MRVYVESNFVLEAVLEQEQHAACEELLTLATARALELVLPAFALLEPYQTVVRRKLDGLALREALGIQRRQLQRTASLASEAKQLQDASDLLLRAAQEAAQRFEELRARLLETARLVAIDEASLRAASAVQAEFSLELPDALIFASVLADAARRPMRSVFLNRNTKDFDDPALKRRPAYVDCALLGSFDAGLARVRSALSHA